MLSLVFEVLIVSVFIWYIYYLYCFNYWRKKGVPTITPTFPAGNILKSTLVKENLFITIEKFYHHFKQQGHKHAGLYFFNGPVYMPIDPEIIKPIMTTHFDHFMDRGGFVDEKNFPLSGALFTVEGSKWRNLRQKLSPTFTSGKLKTMYEIFQKTTEGFIYTVEQKVEANEEINIKRLSSQFTADLILSTAFGLEGTVMKEPDGRLGKIVQNLFNVSTWSYIKSVLTEGLQNPGKLTKAFLYDRSHEYALADLLEKNIKYREENNVNRKDFLQLLLEVEIKKG